jgi:hypothetical protein
MLSSHGPADANPRHLVVHPNGLFTYVVFGEANELGIYKRDNDTGKLSYTNVTYPLIPSGMYNHLSICIPCRLGFTPSFEIYSLKVFN